MRVIRDPCRIPINAHATSAAAIAAHQGQPTVGWTSSAMTTALTPATNPLDRAISPSRRANTSPIASRLKTAACTRRLTRLPAVRKWLLATWNRTETSSRPATTGRTPVSPPLIRTEERPLLGIEEGKALVGGDLRGVSLHLREVRLDGAVEDEVAADAPAHVAPEHRLRRIAPPRTVRGRRRAGDRARELRIQLDQLAVRDARDAAQLALLRDEAGRALERGRPGLLVTRMLHVAVELQSPAVLARIGVAQAAERDADLDLVAEVGEPPFRLPLEVRAEVGLSGEDV